MNMNYVFRMRRRNPDHRAVQRQQGEPMNMNYVFRMQNGLNATVHRLRICTTSEKNIARHCAALNRGKDVLNPRREMQILPAYGDFAVRIVLEKESLYLVYLDLMNTEPVGMIVNGLRQFINRTLMVADYVVYRGVAYSTLESPGMLLLEAVENAVPPFIAALLAKGEET